MSAYWLICAAAALLAALTVLLVRSARTIPATLKTAITVVLIAAIFWVISGLIDLFRGISNGDLPARGWVIFGGVVADGSSMR